jgi:hypothetical protein
LQVFWCYIINPITTMISSCLQIHYNLFKNWTRQTSNRSPPFGYCVSCLQGCFFYYRWQCFAILHPNFFF